MFNVHYSRKWNLTQVAHLKKNHRRAYLQTGKGTCKGVEAPGAGDRGKLLPEVPGEEIVFLQPSWEMAGAAVGEP